MTIVKPFKGITYNLEKVLLKQVISPPLCLSSTDMNESYATKSFYNISNLALSKPEDKYQDAATKYQQWKQEEVLLKESEAAFYLYEQQFVSDGAPLTRTGIVGLMKINGDRCEESEDVAFKSSVVSENLEFIKSIKSNVNQVLGLYLDNSKRMENMFVDIKKNMPELAAVDEKGIKNTIWSIKDCETIQMIETFMKDKDVLIADGCDSYHTALQYCKHMRKMNGNTSEDVKAYDFTMITFVNLFDEGTKVFNSVRVVTLDANFDNTLFFERLKEKFEVIQIDGDVEFHDFPIQMTFAGKEYGLVIEDEVLEKLHPIHRKIDAYVLHKVLIEDVLNIGSPDCDLKLDFVNAQSVPTDLDNKIVFEVTKQAKETVQDVFENGSSMFGTLIYSYPELQSGLLMNDV